MDKKLNLFNETKPKNKNNQDEDLSQNDSKNVYFYKRNSKREVVPCKNNEINKKAKKKLNRIFDENNNIPSRYRKNKQKVKLYDPKGNVDKAKGLIINPENGAYSLRNKLNDLTGKEWIKFTCSWFIFNAKQSDLKQEREITADTELHPATFSPTMISKFIKFFTKENELVLDPFAGIGSTLEACKRTNRVGYGIELNKKYFEIIKKRAPEFKDNIFNLDSRKIKSLNLPKFKFSISSPPYWDMLNRSTKDFKNTRENNNLDVDYSDSKVDLGNIKDYQSFISELSQIYFDIYDLLENKGYIVIIVKNVKKGGKLYPLAWDLANKLQEKYVLKDEKIWLQDKIGLSPYGYPYAWVSNILHHYCLIFRKE